ncbi:MAG: hypothetical protein L6R36_000249 [Xanthoria steineri]|nr:MAG: hypothetical protein L6R36_000249 [Xanthoria steineri]
MLTSYHELNGAHVDELEKTPSPLLLMQYIAKNRPFVLRGGAASWPATSLWDPAYLAMKMGNSSVKVAITPSGNADSPVRNPTDGRVYFTKPLEVEEPFDDFLTQIRQQEVGETSSTEVKYSQAQDDNLRGEYFQLYPDVPEDVWWATECLGAPDAVNVWIGNGRSTTALHKDNYENIYCQIRGKKRFVLLPSVETPCVNIRFLPQAIYTRRRALSPDSPSEDIPWPVWDPDRPGEEQTRFSRLSIPLHVELGPGDMLYLPALWYHKVSQECLEDRISVSVNYWYDMSFAGSLYATNAFITNISKLSNEQGLPRKELNAPAE